MSYTFENSCLASNSELELFSNHPTQASIEEGMHVEHIPTSSVQDDSPIKFFVSGDSNYYMDLKSSYLHLEVKITKADGSNIDDDAEVAPINLIGQTLFQQIYVSLNDVIITDSSNLYHYRAMIETLLSYSDESKQSQLTMSMFAKDTANAMEARDDSNKGFVERKNVDREK